MSTLSAAGLLVDALIVLNLVATAIVYSVMVLLRRTNLDRGRPERISDQVARVLAPQAPEREEG